MAALARWPGDENKLRGKVRTVLRPIGRDELSSLPELLTVAFGAGGVGTVLASSAKTWLQTRRTAARITVSPPGARRRWISTLSSDGTASGTDPADDEHR